VGRDPRGGGKGSRLERRGAGEGATEGGGGWEIVGFGILAQGHWGGKGARKGGPNIGGPAGSMRWEGGKKG